jgi:hypothetical protein
MVDEQYLNGTYFKRYSNDTNEHLLFILTGQSMSPRAFWDFKLPDGKTHSEYFYEAGIDVILFDPIGYGKSTEYYPYDRISYSNQIKTVTDTITKQYNTKTILGYSTSTAPALCNTKYGFFDKIIIKGPGMVYGLDDPLEQPDDFITSISNLKKSRLGPISDRIIPNPHKLSTWEDSLTDIVKTSSTYDHTNDTWKVPGQVVCDRRNYWIENKQHGFNVEHVPPMIIIHGEYDFESIGDESSTGALSYIKPLFPDAKIKIVPGSTHFSMWENNSDITRKYIIEYCKE